MLATAASLSQSRMPRPGLGLWQGFAHTQPAIAGA